MESHITTMENLQALNQYNKRKIMKKILLLLLLIAASVRIIRLSAYCTYNHSNDESIRIRIYKVKNKKTYRPEATHVLLHKGDKACWNWKKIDSNNREKEMGWRAYTLSGKDLGEGYFPIGGAILFFWVR